MTTPENFPVNEELRPVSEEQKEEILGVVTPEPQPPVDNRLADFGLMKPGARLRHAREQKNLSIPHVADRLYLNVNVIKALEADDYDSLPSPVFVRGYLRNYAKLLEIPVDSVLDGYTIPTNKLSMSTSIVPTSSAKTSSTPASSSDSWVKAVTFSLIIIFIAFMVLWRIYPRDFSDTTDLTESSTTQLKPPVRTPSANGETTATTTTNNDAKTVAGSTDNKVTTSTTGNLSTPALTTTGSTEKENKLNLTAATAMEPTTPPVPEVNKDVNTLKISVKKNVWLKITDQNKQRLYDQSAKPDQEVAVTGTPPFKIVVGYINAGVVVEYLGEKTDFMDLSTRKNKTATVAPPETIQ